MANEVRVVFTSQDTGVIALVDAINGSMADIVRYTIPAGGSIDKVTRSFDGLGLSARKIDDLGVPFVAARANAVKLAEGIDLLNQKYDETVRKARQLDIEASRFRNSRQPVTGGFDPLGSLPGQIGAGGATGRATSVANQLDLSRAAKEARDLDRQMERVTQTRDKATAAQQKFTGSVIIGQTVLSQFGVHGSRAIEIVTSQVIGLAEQGKKPGEIFKALTGNTLLGFTVLTAGALAFGEAVSKVFGDIRKTSEEILRITEKHNVVSEIGLIGGSDRTKSELQQLYQLESDVQKLRHAGRDDDAFRLLQENKLTDEAIKTHIDAAKSRAEALGLDTRPEREIEAAKKAEEARKKQISDFNELNKLKLDQSNREFEVQERQRKLSEGAGIATKQLSQQFDAASNPFVSIFDQAEIRLDQFKKQYGSLGTDIVAKFAEANDKLKTLDIFKVNLARTDRLNDLLTQQEQLRAGLGGAGRRADAQSVAEQQADIIREIETRRAAFQLSPQDQLALLAKASALGKTDVARQLEDEARARQIISAQSALSQAQGPAQQQIALERLLQVTSDIGKLSPEQVDIRLKALEQRIAIEPAAEQAKQQREDRQIAAQEQFTEGLKRFTETLARGLGIDIQIKDSPTTRTEVTGTEPSPFDN